MFIGRWKCVFNERYPNTEGQELEINGEGLSTNDQKYPFSWFYNEYCVEVHVGDVITIFVLSLNDGILYGFPTRMKNGDYYMKYERISESPHMEQTTTLSPLVLREFRLRKWKGKYCNGSIVEVTNEAYVNKRYKRSTKITTKLNPYVIEVTFDKEIWIYILSTHNNMKLYGMPIKCASGWGKYFGVYPPYSLSQLHGRKRIGFYRNKLLKDRNKVSGMDYVMFQSYCPYEEFEFVHVYRDELLQENYRLKDKVDLICFGGGMASSWDKALTDVGKTKLIRFVREGGAFFGVCASAFIPAATNATYRGSHWGYGMVRMDLVQQDVWRRGQSSSCVVKYTEEGVNTLFSMFSGGQVEVRDHVRYANGPIFKVISNEEYGQNRKIYAEKCEYEPLKNLILETLELPDPVIFSVFESNVANTASSKRDSMVGTPNLVGQDYGRGRVVVSSAHFENKLTAQTLKYLVRWLLKM